MPTAQPWPRADHSHIHPVAGDWTPRCAEPDRLHRRSFLNGGVATALISAKTRSTVPGRPRGDVVGSQRDGDLRPARVPQFPPRRVGGPCQRPVIEPGTYRGGFQGTHRRQASSCSAKWAWAAAGMSHRAQDGGVGAKAAYVRAPSTAPAAPRSRFRAIDADVVLEADTDVVGHINGGRTHGTFGADPCIQRRLQDGP